ncbi:MAG TPA: hypothetical protein VFE47_26535 [Tepidisphaeraceae bacterium]|jgi:hypothetical protein|nr:hypothetical protein [Tepidisphaeraceae bacterium]
MNRIWIRSLSIALLLLTASAAHAKRVKPPAAWYERAFLKAPAVVAYSHRIKTPMAWMTDDEADDYIVLAVGENMPDHFTRGLTVRVHRSGAVYVLEETDNGQIWRLDRAPDRRPTHHD